MSLRIRTYFLSKPAFFCSARECADKIGLETQGSRLPNLRMLTLVGAYFGAKYCRTWYRQAQLRSRTARNNKLKGKTNNRQAVLLAAWYVPTKVLRTKAYYTSERIPPQSIHQ